jgi:hypothetical protein
LPQPSFNPSGTVSSASRASCCQHHAETYRFIQGKLTLVVDWDESLTTDGRWLETSERKLVKGRWHTMFKRERQREPQ